MAELFGLRCGQLHGGSKRMSKNSGWYNKSGEKLGFGDLSEDDILRIGRGLQGDELFIVLGEQDSYWSFNREIGSATKETEGLTEEAPGVNYVADKCFYVFAPGRLLSVGYADSHLEELARRNGLFFALITHKQAKAMMRNGLAPV